MSDAEERGAAYRPGLWWAVVVSIVGAEAVALPVAFAAGWWWTATLPFCFGRGWLCGKRLA
jgi:hypothetical protein